MNESIRKERLEKYGSFLYCPMQKILCFGRMTDDECKHDSCLLHDPEYQALQKRIEENRKRNQQKKQEKPPKVRKVAKTRIELLEEQIRKRDNEARTAYRANRPREGDRITNEVVRLQGLLRQEKKQDGRIQGNDK